MGAGDQAPLHLFHKVTHVISGYSTPQDLITPQRPLLTHHLGAGFYYMHWGRPQQRSSIFICPPLTSIQELRAQEGSGHRRTRGRCQYAGLFKSLLKISQGENSWFQSHADCVIPGKAIHHRSSLLLCKPTDGSSCPLAFCLDLYSTKQDFRVGGSLLRKRS